MTYRCEYHHLALGVLASIFAFDVVFHRIRGNAWLKMPWMHVKLGFVFFAFVSLYHSQMPSDIQTVAK
jgi:putative membrane protein